MPWDHRRSISSTQSQLVALPSKVTPPLRLTCHTLARVLRNSSLYIAVGWLFAYFFTLGNLFSGLPPEKQSSATFGSANISWFNGVFSTCMIIIMAAKLQREQFVERPTKRIAGPIASTTRRLTLVQCMIKLLRPMAPHIVLSLFGAIGGNYGVYTVIPEAAHTYKPILYIAFFWGFHVMIMADIFARRIFKTETVRGLLASTLRSHTEASTVVPNAGVIRRRRRSLVSSMRQFFRVYYQNLPVIVFTLIAIVYVHAVSQFLKLSGQWEMLAFGCGSIALKLVLQELAKHIMIAVRRPVSRRVMVALVSTPTILVDTQVRMLLLRQNSLNVSLAGTVLLAVFEIVVRAVKSLVVQRQTRAPGAARRVSRRRSSHGDDPLGFAHESRIKAVQVAPTTDAIPATQEKSDGTRTLSLVYSLNNTPAEHKAQKNAEYHRRKLRVLHAAEIYADMYAEYIAIGCSYAILFFYRNHPQYQFSLLLSKSNPTSTSWQDSQLVSLCGLQVSIEVAVDFLACVFEAAHGVEFKSFNQNDPFLIFFLAMLTFSNVAISGGMYLH